MKVQKVSTEYRIIFEEATKAPDDSAAKPAEVHLIIRENGRVDVTTPQGRPFQFKNSTPSIVAQVADCIRTAADLAKQELNNAEK